MTDREYPRFITESDECIWCGTYAKLFSVYANEETNVVEATYECKNAKCDHVRYFNRPHNYKIINFGKNAVSILKEYQKKSASKNTGEA